jgi:hypothetical protein
LSSKNSDTDFRSCAITLITQSNAPVNAWACQLLTAPLAEAASRSAESRYLAEPGVGAERSLMLQ